MGDINYNLGGIEGNLAALHATHAAQQDLAHQMVSHYTQLDAIASGQSTDAGMEFSNIANHSRQQFAELQMALHQGVSTASQDMQGVDHGFMGAMGI